VFVVFVAIVASTWRSIGRPAVRMNPEIIGWVSSALLVFTIGRQVWKQWQDGSSEGVSMGLFVGQMAASLGFLVYSWMVQNWVFVVTNGIMVLNGLIGLGITMYHRRNNKGAEES
jgi:uncharacterized protein with PQ loop repeat